MLYHTKNPHGGDIYGEEVKLEFSANTNPFGTPQGVLSAIQENLDKIYCYPDPYCRKLIQAISNFEGVPNEYILCGNGASELIYSYCEALKPKKAVELAPTFSEYALGLERVGCKVERYTLNQESGFELDEGFLNFLNKIVPDMMLLCNPNNPTGRTITPSLLEKILVLCAEKNIRLFVDECFLDMADSGESLKGFLVDNSNLFILKAFTKSYGMAGIRLGYCMTSDSDLLTKMSKAVQPWNVSSLAQTAGITALKEHEFLQKTKRLIVAERKLLKAELESLGFWVCPSEANYLLFNGPDDLHTELMKKRILIRNCDNYHGLGNGWYRIAVRLHEENEELIRTMKQICKKE